MTVFHPAVPSTALVIAHARRLAAFGLLGALAATLALFAAPRAASAQAVLDASRIGSVPVRKTVRTFRDLRFRDLDRQRYDFSCGTAALATLLRHGYGIDTSETELIKAMMVGADPQEVVRNGFSMLDMKRHVERIGLRAHGFRIPPEALYQLQMPVIALMDVKGYKHFVLVKGAAGGRVFVADPALGHRVVFERDFVAGWNGIVLAVLADTPMRDDSYLFRSRASYAMARRVDALDRVSAPPPVVEFGLIRADLF